MPCRESGTAIFLFWVDFLISMKNKPIKQVLRYAQDDNLKIMGSGICRYTLPKTKK